LNSLFIQGSFLSNDSLNFPKRLK